MNDVQTDLTGVVTAYEVLRLLVELIVPASVYVITVAWRLRRFSRLNLTDLYRYLPYSLLYVALIRLLAQIPYGRAHVVSDSAYRSLLYGNHWTNVQDVAFVLFTLYLAPFLWAYFRVEKAMKGSNPPLDDGWELWIEAEKITKKPAWAIITLNNGRRIGVSVDDGLTYSPGVRVLRFSKQFQVLNSAPWLGRRVSSSNEILVAADAIDTIEIYSRHNDETTGTIVIRGTRHA